MAVSNYFKILMLPRHPCAWGSPPPRRCRSPRTPPCSFWKDCGVSPPPSPPESPPPAEPTPQADTTSKTASAATSDASHRWYQFPLVVPSPVPETLEPGLTLL